MITKPQRSMLRHMVCQHQHLLSSAMMPRAGRPDEMVPRCRPANNTVRHETGHAFPPVHLLPIEEMEASAELQDAVAVYAET